MAVRVAVWCLLTVSLVCCARAEPVKSAKAVNAPVTLALVPQLPHHTAVVAVALADRAKVGFSASTDGALHVWSVETGELLQATQLPGGAPRALASTSDAARVVAVRGDGRATSWDWRTGDITATAALPAVTAATLSQDGATAYLGTETGELQAYSLPSWSLSRSYAPCGKTVRTLAAGLDGSIVAACGQCEVHAFDVNAQRVADWSLGDKHPCMAGFSGQEVWMSKSVATWFGFDAAEESVLIPTIPGGNGQLEVFAVNSRQGDSLIFTTSPSGYEAYPVPPDITAIATSPDGSEILFGDSVGSVGYLQPKSSLRAFIAPDLLPKRGAFSVDGQRVGFHAGGEVRILDLPRTQGPTVGLDKNRNEKNGETVTVLNGRRASGGTADSRDQWLAALEGMRIYPAPLGPHEHTSLVCLGEKSAFVAGGLGSLQRVDLSDGAVLHLADSAEVTDASNLLDIPPSSLDCSAKGFAAFYTLGDLVTYNFTRAGLHEVRDPNNEDGHITSPSKRDSWLPYVSAVDASVTTTGSQIVTLDASGVMKFWDGAGQLLASNEEGIDPGFRWRVKRSELPREMGAGAVAIAGDGTFAVGGRTDVSAFRTYPQPSSKPLWTVPGPLGDVHGIAISSNGAWIAIASQERIQVRDRRGRLARVFGYPFSKDVAYDTLSVTGAGQLAAQRSDGMLWLWEMTPAAPRFFATRQHNDLTYGTVIAQSAAFAITATLDGVRLVSFEDLAVRRFFGADVMWSIQRDARQAARRDAVFRRVGGTELDNSATMRTALAAHGLWLSTDERWACMPTPKAVVCKSLQDDGFFQLDTPNVLSLFQGNTHAEVIAQQASGTPYILSIDVERKSVSQLFSSESRLVGACGDDVVLSSEEGILERTKRDGGGSVVLQNPHKRELSGALVCTATGDVIATTRDGRWLRWTPTGELTEVAVHENAVTSVRALRDGSVLTGGADGKLRMSDASGELIREWTLPFVPISVGSSAGDKLAVGVGPFGQLRLIRIETGAYVDVVTKGEEWIAFDKDGHFDASRGGTDLVRMVVNGRAFRVDQFAHVLNRPDVLLEHLGYGGTPSAKEFTAMHESRLAKAGISGAAKAIDVTTAPTLVMSAHAASGRAELVLEMDAQGGDLAHYQVFVNGVALFPSPGKPATGRSVKVTERIVLSSGKNVIEASVVDRAGVESLRAIRTVEGLPAGTPSLFYVGVGVEQYRDEALKLDYSVNDIADLGRALASSSGFASVEAFTLTDGEVTIARLEEARRFMERAGVDDVVVLAVAGHGMYSDESIPTYYFLTADADPDRLAQTALPFERIESLVDGIASRKKLVLLDTCDSGEWVAGARPVDPSKTTLRARAIKRVRTATQRSPDPTGPTPAATHYRPDPSRLIYADLSRRTGAIVLSSSRSGQSSFEDARFENGLFTEAVLLALSSTEADADKDGSVDTNELRTYVRSRVGSWSSGAQTPTVDRDNIAARIVFGLPLKAAKTEPLDEAVGEWHWIPKGDGVKPLDFRMRIFEQGVYTIQILDKGAIAHSEQGTVRREGATLYLQDDESDVAIPWQIVRRGSNELAIINSKSGMAFVRNNVARP